MGEPHTPPDRWLPWASWLHWLSTAVALIVSGTAFAVYGAAAPPAPYLLDSAEIAEGAFSLGLIHPPGEPLTLLWGRLVALLLPLGGPAFRAGVAQGLAGAAAAALVFFLAQRLTTRLAAAVADKTPETPWASPLARLALSAAAAISYAIAPGTFAAAARPEVYALQTALSLGALTAGLAASERRDLRLALVAAFLIGLGLCNHPLLAGLTGLGAVVAALPVVLPALRAEPARVMIAALVALGAGALVLVYLPLRAAAGAIPLWGDASSLSGFLSVITAETFRDKSPIVQSQAHPGDLPFVFIEEMGLVLALAALVGGAVLLRVRGLRIVGAALLTAIAGSIVAALMAGFDPSNPDIRGYIGTALALGFVFSAVAGVAVVQTVVGVSGRLGGRRPHLPQVAAWVLAAITLTAPGVAWRRLPEAFAAGDRSNAWAADRLASHLLAELPPRAILLTSHFQTAFLIAYLRNVEGARPDVSWVHLGRARDPAYAATVAREEPALAPLLAAHAAGSVSWVPFEALAEARRPVHLEPDPFIAPQVWPKLQPGALTWRASSWNGKTAWADAWREDDWRPRLEAALLAEARADPQVKGFLAWRAFIDTRAACTAGQAEAMWRGFRTLGALVPRDPNARALSFNCQRLNATAPVDVGNR